MLVCMEKDLLPSDPEFSSPVQVYEHGVNVLCTVFLDSQKGPNLCTFILTTISRGPKTISSLLWDLTCRLISEMLFQGFQGKGLDLPSLRELTSAELKLNPCKITPDKRDMQVLKQRSRLQTGEESSDFFFNVCLTGFLP